MRARARSAGKRRPSRGWLARGLTATTMFAGAVLLIAWQGRFRILEAYVTGAIANVTQLAPSHPAGSSVFFPAKHLFIDFHIVTGCTAALLISPFFALAAGAVAVNRTSVAWGAATLVGTAVAIFMVNQARLLTIVFFIRHWGYPRGYDVGHILVGTVISTLGLLGGLVVFVFCLKRGPRPQAAVSG